MSIETNITHMLGIRYPIIQGGLQGLGTFELASAVSNAGGLGLITAGSFKSKKEMLVDIEKAYRTTDKPFGVNITIGLRKPMDEFVEGAIEAEIPIVFTSGNNPEPFVYRLKERGVKVVHVAPSIRFARKAESLGCDAVVVNGFECAGHPGKSDTTSLVLAQKAANTLRIPVIAAGGFSTGKSLLAALALGAEGVQMGTRFLLSEEVMIHEKVKRHLVHMDEEDTILVKKSIGKVARVWKSERAIELVEMESRSDVALDDILPYISGESYEKLIKEGDFDSGIIALGQTVGLIDQIKPVKAIIDDIVTEYHKQLKKLYHVEEENCHG